MPLGEARFTIRVPLPGTQAEADDERRRAARLFGRTEEAMMADTTTDEQRFRRLARQGAIEAIRKRCEQLRTETEDGLVLHAANDIEQQGELLYRHTKDLAADLARMVAYAKRIEQDYIFKHGDRTFWSDDEAHQRIAEERARDGVADIMA